MSAPVDPDLAGPDLAGPDLAGPDLAGPAAADPTPPATAPPPPAAPSALPPSPPQRPTMSAGARRPRPVFLLVGIGLAALLAGVLVAIGATHAPSSRPGAVGTQVPSFSLARLGGSGRVSVPSDGGGDGRPAILLFFASWCTDCHEEVPALARTYHEQQLRHSSLAGVRVLGVDVMDPSADALRFMRASGVTFPVGADVVEHVTQTEFELTGLPTSVFVEANGTIAGVHQGALSTKSFVSWEHKLLATT